MRDADEPTRRSGPSGSRGDHDELLDELDLTFRAELSERLPRLLLGLNQLRDAGEEPPRALLDGLAREAHSIKGGAMVVGRGQVARVAEALETSFDELAGRERPVAIDVDALAGAVAAVQSLAGAARAGSGDGDALADRAVAAIRNAATDDRA